jgi:hypothetical protein
VILTGARKLAFTAVLFAMAVGCVALAVAANNVAPLFAAWIPLLAVAWVLARPSPGDPVRPLPEEEAPGSRPEGSKSEGSRRNRHRGGSHRPGRVGRAGIVEPAGLDELAGPIETGSSPDETQSEGAAEAVPDA